MDYLKLDRSAYDKLLARDPKHIQMDICDYILFLKKEGKSSAAIDLYVAAIRVCN
jgi:hypothetical protein